MKHNKTVLILLACAFAATAGAQESWHALGLPAARRSATMVLDSVNQRIIMFGGTSNRANGYYYSDVWELPVDAPGRYYWSQVVPAGNTPTERSWHCSACDVAHNKMYVFSGVDGGLPFNDVWSLDLTLGSERWQMLDPSNSPQPRHGASAAIFHPGRNSLIIFGGWDGTSNWFNDVWELKLDSMVWRQLSLADPKPVARSGIGICYDQSLDRMLIFGGANGSGQTLNDLWALDLTPGQEKWTELHPGGSLPSLRNCPASGFDSRHRRLYCYGGGGSGGEPLGDVYVLDLGSLKWTQLSPSGQIPPPRGSPAGAYDPKGDNFFFFGGSVDDFYYNDAYYLPQPVAGVAEWHTPVSAIPAALLVRSPTTLPVRVRYLLPEATSIEARILDVAGRTIRRLVSSRSSSLSGRLTWDGNDEGGRPLGAGAYYCQLSTSQGTTVSQKFVLIR